MDIFFIVTAVAAIIAAVSLLLKVRERREQREREARSNLAALTPKMFVPAPELSSSVFSRTPPSRCLVAESLRILVTVRNEKTSQPAKVSSVRIFAETTESKIPIVDVCTQEQIVPPSEEISLSHKIQGPVAALLKKGAPVNLRGSITLVALTDRGVQKEFPLDMSSIQKQLNQWIQDGYTIQRMG